MKKTIITAITLTILTASSFFAQTVDYSKWSFTNTAGLEPYGAITTTLKEGLPYFNNETAIMKSPKYNYSGSIQVSFIVKGRIQKNHDFMYFDVKIDGTWVELDSYTHKQKNKLYTYTIEDISNSVKFRFRLVADCDINTYNCGRDYYYYDVKDFTITEDVALPVTMGDMDFNCEELSWFTESERNSSHFLIYYSEDGVNFNEIYDINSAGNSNEIVHYSVENYKGEGYFYIQQFDIDGKSEVFDTIYVKCNSSKKQIESVYDINGNKTTLDANGLKIVKYTDGTTTKIYKSNN